ncbi:ferric reductase-like transmembrane domain-containing protein [Lysinibacillus sp. NPDC094403]|uniref:ferric reductase-like transmembrane domain-containing protein n=1 Tax=Lysinibacillus sp. NPDC094403 TaxID=3390581 RepID=UPI003CFCB183
MIISTWEWIRLLGLLAYFYFTISIIFGLLRKSSFVKSHKNLIYHIHQNAGWLGLITVIAHMLVLLIDHYEPYSIVEILIPVTAKYQSIPSAFGTIAFYLFLMVIMTSDLWIRTMNRSLWKKLHFLVLPAWVISLAHGVLIGTDTENALIMMFYVVSGGITMLVLATRTISQFMNKVNVSTTHNS